MDVKKPCCIRPLLVFITDSIFITYNLKCKWQTDFSANISDRHQGPCPQIIWTILSSFALCQLSSEMEQNEATATVCSLILW